MKSVALIPLALFVGGCAAPPRAVDFENAHWLPQQSGSTASFRGVCALSDQVCWVSGSGGTFARTVDGGNTWRSAVVPQAADLDFRDIHAIDARTAWLLSAGEPAKIFTTSDGGRHWVAQYSNAAAGVFFDAFDFWDDQNAIAFSDPLDGSFLIITTRDAGRSWQRIQPELLPPPLTGEAGFAASGACLIVLGSQNVWIATGGGPVARVLHSADRGRTWRASDTPLIAGNASSGIFALAFRDAQNGVAVGGDYQKPEQRTGNCAVTDDGGRTWRLVERHPPSGYRSCVAYVPRAPTPTLVAVGVSGSDMSTDDGRTWQSIGTTGYHSVSFAPNGAGWAVGAHGRVAKFAIE